MGKKIAIIFYICLVSVVIVGAIIYSSGTSTSTDEYNYTEVAQTPNVVKTTSYSETKTEEKRASTPYGTYTFSENGYEYKVILKADETAQLILEKGAKIRPVEGDVAYGSWDEGSSYGIDAEFKVKEIITDPFSVGKWDVKIGIYHCYFKEGFVYHDWRDAKAKDPTHRVSFTKTN